MALAIPAALGTFVVGFIVLAGVIALILWSVGLCGCETSGPQGSERRLGSQ